MDDTTGDLGPWDPASPVRPIPPEDLRHAPAESDAPPSPPHAADEGAVTPWAIPDEPPEPPAPPPPPEPVAERRTVGVRAMVLVALLAGVLGAALSALVVALAVGDGNDATTVVERVETQIVSADGEVLPTATAVARRVLPSIVTVEIGTGGAGTFVTDGSGSGVVVDAENRLLVTNQHVVDGANSVRVVFADGRAYDAEVIGEDHLTDLAVVRIDASGLTAVEIGAAEALDIGDTAIAIGSPLGLEGGPSVTVGVVSAFNWRVRTNGDSELFGMLQTDAPITRGSSGGALVDSEGRLIGITTAIGVSDVGAEGLGFAIPVEMVIRITDELIETGTVQHAFLGITGSTFFEDAPDGATVPSGVVIASVIDGSAADEAGLETGDVIRTFDGESVTTMERLVVGLRFYRVGQTVTVEVDRGDETRSLDVTLLARPEDV